MKKKIALVTGGAGFIGSHIVDLLISKKYKVIVIDNLSGGHLKNIKHNLNKKNFVFLKKDICDLKNKIAGVNKIDFIFHMAGKGDIVPSIINPKTYIKNNVLGTLNILEIAKFYNVKKIVYAASSSCYGLAKTPTNENHKIEPMYPYAMSKKIGEELLFHWGKVYGVKVLSIRIFNAYGPRVKTTGAYGAVFGVFFKQKLSNKPYTLVGDGSQKRDFVYVTDVAQAFYKAAISKFSNIALNLGSGKPKSIMQLIKLLGGSYVKIPKRPGEPEKTHANISKISKMLKWSPKINFDQGVKSMLINISEWKKAPLWTKKKIDKETRIWFKYLSKK